MITPSLTSTWPYLARFIEPTRALPLLDLDDAIERLGFKKLNIALEVGATDALLDVLMPGQHVSFLPRFAVIDRLEAGRLYHIKVVGFRIMRTLWIARHRNNIDHLVADAFISIIPGA